MSILVRRAGALGDVIEATAIVRRLRDENPDTVIDFETGYPDVFRGSRSVTNAHRSLPAYDRVIDLDGAFERALRKLHPIDAYSEVAFGDRVTPHRLEYAWEPASSRLRALVGERCAVLHAARSWPIRTLPLTFWQGLVDGLRERLFRVVLTGTAQDHEGLTGVVDLRRSLSLAEQGGLIAAACCFICSESGPMILAQTTQTPVIALLTMVPPEHVRHEGAGPFHAVRAAVPCVGCAAEQPKEATYFDCRPGHRDCVTRFDPGEIAGLAALWGRRAA